MSNTTTKSLEPRVSLSVPPPSGNPTVLVIDDSDIARAEMIRILTDAGLRAVGLSSPIGATRAILENAVNVVVIDVMMPSMRGDRLAALFRGNPRFKGLGVVLVSGEDEGELFRLAAEVGADAVVAKSRIRELFAAVQRASRSRESALRHG
jgi:PleD family two-component response regulator